jgi:hypothetical protein
MIRLFGNKIITRQEKNILLEWIGKNESRFIQNPMGPHRRYYPFSEDPYIPKLFLEIKHRIIKREKIKKWYLEPMFKDYVGVISNGGFIHEHQDANYQSLNHVRYNLFLSTPKSGGEPVYNGKKLKMKEREYLKCLSGNERHSCNVVVGDKPRIVISYGFLI